MSLISTDPSRIKRTLYQPRLPTGSRPTNRRPGVVCPDSFGESSLESPGNVRHLDRLFKRHISIPHGHASRGKRDVNFNGLTAL